MKYYGIFKNNELVEANIIPIKADGLESREITLTEYETFKQNKTVELNKQNRIVEIEARLDALDKDFRQADLGADFGTKILEDGTEIKVIDERKAEFIALHNELRTLQGKPLREYIKKEV